MRAGRLTLARQRLRGLVGSFPHRLDLRERLAEIYREEGDLAQAGRWSYLSERTDPGEQKSFELAYRNDPVRMMRALSWRGPEDAADTETARSRLRNLRARAEDRAGTSVDWFDPRYPQPKPGWGERAIFAGVFLLGLAALGGLISVLVDGVTAVASWIADQFLED